MLSTRVLTLLGRTAAHAWRIAHRNSCTVERGSSMSWVQTPIRSQTCSMGFISGLNELASPWPPHPLVAENQSCHMLCGEWHCPGHTQSFVEKRPSPRETYYCGEAWCSEAVEGSIQHHPLLPPWWMAPHIMTEAPPTLVYLQWVGFTHLSVSPLACGAHEKIPLKFTPMQFSIYDIP